MSACEMISNAKTTALQAYKGVYIGSSSIFREKRPITLSGRYLYFATKSLL